LKVCNNEISAAKAKLESNNREMIEGINNRIEQSEIKKQELLATSRDLTTQRNDIEKTIEDENANIISLNQTGRELVKSYKDLEVTKQRLKAQKENKLKAFGHRMPEALVAIANERRWTGQLPVGPFGQYMNLKHPEFAEVMEISLGTSLSNFAVENFQDQALLRHILARHDLGKCNIMVAKKDLFDYSNDEPDSSLLTILRAIDFENEYVKRQLVISNNIHQIILMQERVQAEDLMNGHPRNVKLCFTRDCQTVGAKTGMRTESLKRHKGPIRFKKDVDGDIR
jgi:chromosome segregation ATPase